jgi:predicted MPP superfamily phosphohydrolase
MPFTGRPVVPFLAWKYFAGLRKVGDLLLYTSRGMGTMQPPFIFKCRPEVTLLRLRRMP